MGTTARHEGYICPSRLMFPHRIALHPRYGCCRLQAADDADVGKQIHVGHHLKVPVIYMLTIDNLGLWALCLDFEEAGAAMVVAFTNVPERRVAPLSAK